MQSWASTPQRASEFSDRPKNQVTYGAKVKLDGTNGGVQVSTHGEVIAQSRNQIITTEDDNIEGILKGIWL